MNKRSGKHRKQSTSKYGRMLRRAIARAQGELDSLSRNYGDYLQPERIAQCSADIEALQATYYRLSH